MNLKVSVIVPVYNAGEYLTKCLDSLLAQTLKEIEIILVLDMPTDGSDKVAEKYAEHDNRIKIIKNKSNLHIGFSRNAGIEKAVGEYIGFSDDDDFLEPEMLEKLYNVAVENNADIVVSNYCNESGNRIDKYCFPTLSNIEEFKQNFFDALIKGSHSQANVITFNNVNSIWNQIFRRNMIIENNIRFTDNKMISMEDVIFNIQAHFFAKKIAFVPEIFYHHIVNNTNEYKNYDYLSLKKVASHLEFVYNFLNKNGVGDKYKVDYAFCALRRLYTSWRNELKFKKLTASFSFFSAIRSNAEIQKIINPIYLKKEILKKFPVTKRTFAYIIRK